MPRLFAIGLLCCTPALAGETSPSADLVDLVHQDCGSCHGLTLKGGLGPDIRPQSLSHYDVETLSTVVLDGIPETAMPPWRPLMSEADAKRVAEYLLQGELK
ncbi:c-type cytochrome [Roseibium album]|uniref:Cytochrome c551 n=1 Tax=Roseibium album TaxID=311410 RepID=A0A0M7A5K1_9HYPH|nr:cytochrome c [Roseibium album]CTQ63337.1 Cytochrome c551 [Roseibium album]CTQ69742.1 Cytochrome c551 [Roseibium album]CTQ80924.1 Cytochrome c551 [Roseibium album]